MDKLVYYDVPQEEILLLKKEEGLIGKDIVTEGWNQINFTRLMGDSHRWIEDSSSNPLSSPEFFENMLWELKKSKEQIQIKIRKRKWIPRFELTYEITNCKTKEELRETLNYVMAYAPVNCIGYHMKGELQKAILVESGEMLNFFVKPEECSVAKAIMAKYAEETEYYRYEAGAGE